MRLLQDWFPYQSNITLSRYAFELTDVFTHERIMKNFPGMDMHLFAHSPDAVSGRVLVPSSAGGNAC